MKKVYVNTVDEFVKALDKGKVIVDSCNEGIIYKKNNALIVEQKEKTVLNSGVFFYKRVKDRYYYEEKEKLDLRIGRFYKTEFGHKVFIFSYVRAERKFLGVVVGYPPMQSIYRFNQDGTQYRSYRRIKLVEEIKPEEV